MERIPIIINSCYGGYGYSEKAILEYNKRKKESEPNFTSIEFNKYCVDKTEILNTDILMCKIVEELGDNASADFAKLCVKWVPKQFLNYVKIHEYDGFESIQGYNLDCYKIDNIKNVLNDDSQNSDEKIKHIKEIVDLKLTDEYYNFEKN